MLIIKFLSILCMFLDPVTMEIDSGYDQSSNGIKKIIIFSEPNFLHVFLFLISIHFQWLLLKETMLTIFTTILSASMEEELLIRPSFFPSLSRPYSLTLLGKTKSISCWSFFWTSGWVANVYITKERVVLVVSWPAKINVIDWAMISISERARMRIDISVTTGRQHRLDQVK